MNETLQGEIWIFKWLPLNDHYTPQSEKVDEWVHFPLKPTEESGWFESIDQSHPPPRCRLCSPLAADRRNSKWRTQRSTSRHKIVATHIQFVSKKQVNFIRIKSDFDDQRHLSAAVRTKIIN